MFQTSNPSANLFTFGNMNILMDAQMTAEQIVRVKTIDPSYLPRTTSPLNRTVVHFASKTVVQMEIKLNICEVSVPSNQAFFKTGMLKELINFLLMTLKTFASPKLANEIGFKIQFYAPTGSPASDPQWWQDTGLTTLGWKKEDQTYGQTVLGVPLPLSCCRYTLLVWLDDNYNLIKEPVCSRCRSQTVSNFPPSTNVCGNWNNLQQQNTTTTSTVNPQPNLFGNWEPNITAMSGANVFGFPADGQNGLVFGSGIGSTVPTSQVNPSQGFGTSSVSAVPTTQPNPSQGFGTSFLSAVPTTQPNPSQVNPSQGFGTSFVSTVPTTQPNPSQVQTAPTQGFGSIIISNQPTSAQVFGANDQANTAQGFTIGNTQQPGNQRRGLNISNTTGFGVSTAQKSDDNTWASSWTKGNKW